MSIISNILEKITGLDLDGSDSTAAVTERPCSNCPSNCAIAGEACTICEPYKKSLIDWVYHVDHLEEFLAQYEVVSPEKIAASSGTTHCPFCGANSSDPYICEYCGSQLGEKPAASGKIQVTAASEIPNPIMKAQDVIWERYDAVIKKYGANIISSTKGIKGGLISDLFSQLIGSGESEEDEESPLGAKMSEAEIREAAGLYKVSLGDYLTGLDNGKYLTLKGKQAADEAGQSASSFTPASMGIPGMAAVGMFADSMFRDVNRRSPSRDVPQRPSQSSRSNDSYRPERQPERPQRPSETRQPAQSGSRRDELQRPSAPVRQPAESTNRRRPEFQRDGIPVSREKPQTSSSGNRRDNLISRTTGERKNPQQPGSARAGTDHSRRDSDSNSSGRRRR